MPLWRTSSGEGKLATLLKNWNSFASNHSELDSIEGFKIMGFPRDSWWDLLRVSSLVSCWIVIWSPLKDSGFWSLLGSFSESLCLLGLISFWDSLWKSILISCCESLWRSGLASCLVSLCADSFGSGSSLSLSWSFSAKFCKGYFVRNAHLVFKKQIDIDISSQVLMLQ